MPCLQYDLREQSPSNGYPGNYGQFESLEQLRALWHGYRISVTLIDAAPAPGVDTPEDAERMRKLFDRAGNSE